MEGAGSRELASFVAPNGQRGAPWVRSSSFGEPYTGAVGSFAILPRGAPGRGGFVRCVSTRSLTQAEPLRCGSTAILATSASFVAPWTGAERGPTMLSHRQHWLCFVAGNWRPPCDRRPVTIDTFYPFCQLGLFRRFATQDRAQAPSTKSLQVSHSTNWVCFVIWPFLMCGRACTTFVPACSFPGAIGPRPDATTRSVPRRVLRHQ